MGLRKKAVGARRPYTSALVAAAGVSQRMGGMDKLMVYLNGCPVLARTLRALDECEWIDEIVVATRTESILKIGDMCREYGIHKAVKIVEGGATRAQSVLNAAHNADARAEYFAVHDGARPLVQCDLIERVLEMGYRCGAAAPAIALTDTIKEVSGGAVERTVDRSILAGVQTPQVFEAALLLSALSAAVEEGAEITDDCSAVERMGGEVRLVDGSYENIKLTTPVDFAIAEKLLELRGDFF